MTPDGQSVYVTNNDSNDISQYDIGAGGSLTPKSQPTIGAGSGPRALAVSPDGRSAYVANEGTDNISQYDISTRSSGTARVGNRARRS